MKTHIPTNFDAYGPDYRHPNDPRTDPFLPENDYPPQRAAWDAAVAIAEAVEACDFDTSDTQVLQLAITILQAEANE